MNKILFVFFILFAGPAFAVELKPCDIMVSFGSYSSGVDQDTVAKVVVYLRGRPSIGVKSKNTGNEGEFDVCLKLKNAQEADKTYEEIKALIPAYSKKAWTKIARGDKSFMTEWPKK